MREPLRSRPTLYSEKYSKLCASPHHCDRSRRFLTISGLRSSSMSGRQRRRIRTMSCAPHVLCMLALPALANESQDTSTSSLKRMSLEELLSVEVSSVSKTDESL